MNKYLRKNGKKIMAVLGILLMIAFALPTATNQISGRGSEAYGSLYGGKTTLTDRERINLANEWGYLKQRLSPNVIAMAIGATSLPGGEDMLLQTLGDSDFASQVQQAAVLGQRNPFLFMQNPNLRILVQALEEGHMIFAQIEDNDDMFPLLVAEAKANGVTVNNDLLSGLLQRRGYAPETDRDEYDSMRQSLHDLLLVINSFERAADAVRISSPARQHALAARLQEMSVNLVEFSAKDLVGQVGEPTPAQIQAHFDKYKDTLAEGSPSGFGYKYPNRVKFDVVILDKEQVRKAVGDIDLVDMFEYFERNKNKPEMILTTQPATRPSSDFTLSNLPPPATKPTTRPKTFDEAKEQIRTTLADQRINELTSKVRDAVRNILVSDYNAWKASQAAAKPGTSQPAPPSSVGPPYNTYEYLQALRDKIQKDHNVTLTIEKRDQWQSADLLKDSDLAKLTWDSQTGAQPIDLPRLLTTRLDAFIAEDVRKQMGGSRIITLWEPTPLFTNELQSQTVIARATAAEPSHSPKSPDEIREKLVADTKTALAYEKAKQAAQAMVDAAKAGKWLATVAADQNCKLITTGEFSPMDMGFFGSFPIQGYEQLKSPALQTFKAEAFKLLSLPERTGGAAPRPINPITPATQPATTQSTTQPTTNPTVATTKPGTIPSTIPTLAAATTKPATTQATFNQHPVGLVELASEAKVLAVEVNSLKAGRRWTKESQPQLEQQIMVEQKMSEESQLKAQWFDYDNLIKRTQFKPQEQRDNPKPNRRPLPRVDNPFVG
jgi:hypothetical protein